MFASLTCQYAVRAMACLASQPPSDRTTVKQMSVCAHIPYPYLLKIIDRLSGAGLVSSRRGPGGGCLLTRSARRIRLIDIIAAIDGLDILDQCASGLATCNACAPCPVHKRWKPLREQYRVHLESTTLEEMARAAFPPTVRTKSVRRQMVGRTNNGQCGDRRLVPVR